MTDPVFSAKDPQTVLNQIVFHYLSDQKRQRRWRWIKRILMLLVLCFFVWVLLFSEDDEVTVSTSKPHVGLIDLKGEIFDGQAASAENFVKSMHKAYKSKGLQAMIFRIDSPGGSPVQADYMYNIIREYHDAHPQIKTYAVCVDSCASAAYYVASAADEIYANPASLVGSIGVVFNGFGFVDTLKKLGVTRRLVTAGRDKGFMDQFSPVNEAQEKRLQEMLNIIHRQFIEKVKAGRGDRLKVNDELFSGLVWTGEQAKALGLIDGYASSGQVARRIVNIKDVVDYTNKQNVLDQLAKRLATTMFAQLPAAFGLHSESVNRFK